VKETKREKREVVKDSTCHLEQRQEIAYKSSEYCNQKTAEYTGQREGLIEVIIVIITYPAQLDICRISQKRKNKTKRK
jgi:hypothetical protein